MIGKEASWDQVLQWQTRCMDSHGTCKPLSQLESNTKDALAQYWPARFLAVGSIDDTTAKVCKVPSLSYSALRYTTLSHRWSQQNPTMLLSKNYKSFEDGIQLTDLQPAFRDAIIVTRKLGVPYIWIDSLCIIQDSVEDWAIESSKMYQVYKNSFLNIVAAVSAPKPLDSSTGVHTGLAADHTELSDGGLFHKRNPWSAMPCIVRTGQSGIRKYAASYFEPEDRSIEKHNSLEVFGRAWVLQELLLPGRSLNFGKEELHWYCCELQATETLPYLQTYFESMYKDAEDTIPHLRQRWRKIQNCSDISRFQTWGKIVEEYSTKQMTKLSDKFVAVAGLASELGTAWNAEHLAGIWSFRFRRGLLWRCKRAASLQRLLNIAPGWSWGSVDCSVSMDSLSMGAGHKFYDGLAEVIEAKVELQNKSLTYGEVISGYVRLRGPLCRAFLEKKHDGTWWVKFTVDATERQRSTPESATGSEDESEIGSEDDSQIGSENESQFNFLTTMETTIQWDDKENEDIILAARVYLAPLETYLDSSGMWLEGLILTPTHSSPGVYRRLGWFEVRDEWEKEERRDPNMIVHEEFNLMPSSDGHYHSRTELHLILTSMSNEKKEEDERFHKLKACFHDSEKIETCDDGPVTGNDLQKEDRYNNGVLNTELLSRYKQHLDVLQVQSFLLHMRVLALLDPPPPFSVFRSS